jgi:hypothetical protein
MPNRQVLNLEYLFATRRDTKEPIRRIAMERIDRATDL